jgi:hypothetical protein
LIPRAPAQATLPKLASSHTSTLPRRDRRCKADTRSLARTVDNVLPPCLACFAPSADLQPKQDSASYGYCP